MGHGTIPSISPQARAQTSDGVVQMTIPDGSHRDSLRVCGRDGIGGTTQIIIIFGGRLTLESFLQGVILLLGFLKLGRERDQHAEKVFGFGDRGVFTVKSQEEFKVLLKTLTDLDNLLDAFFVGIRKFLYGSKKKKKIIREKERRENTNGAMVRNFSRKKRKKNSDLDHRLGS